MHPRICPCENCAEKRIDETAKASAAAVLRAQGVTVPRIAMALGVSNSKASKLLRSGSHTASA